MKSTERFLRRVERGLIDAAVPPGARVLVACSGGPDSTALLSALAELASPWRLELVVAHLSHGLRSEHEQSQESALVEAMCTRLRVPFVFKTIEPGALAAEARSEHRSLEEVARTHRLRFLRRAARARGCAVIALGHTLDDQTETLVMRFFQGSGPRGLAGISPRRGPFVRPLLGCTRKQVMEYLAARGLAWHEDSSNSDRRFLRNSVRLRLLPVVEEIFPGYRRALARLSLKMREAAEVIAAVPEAGASWAVGGDGSLSMPSEEFYRLPVAARTELLCLAVSRIVGDRVRIPFGFVRAVAGRRPHRTSWHMCWGGTRASLQGGRLRVERDIVSPLKTGYFIVAVPTSGGSGPGQAGPYRVSWVGDAEAAAGMGTARIDSRLVRPPAVIRSRRSGDRLRTRAGTRTIKKLLGEWGVPAGERDRVAVLADTEGVVGVVALPWGSCATLREPRGNDDPSYIVFALGAPTERTESRGA